MPNKTPALFVPIKKMFLEDALEYLSHNQVLYFFTDSTQMSVAVNLTMKNIYFSLSGENEISYKADFIEIVTKNPRMHRLPDYSDEEGKFYYGFKNLRPLDEPVEISDLQSYTTENYLLNSTPGARVIFDPAIE